MCMHIVSMTDINIITNFVVGPICYIIIGIIFIITIDIIIIVIIIVNEIMK